MLKKETEQLVIEDNDIIYQSEFFNDLKRKSIIEFRNNINKIQSINPSLYLEEKVDKYYEFLLEQYDSTTGLFQDYNKILNIYQNGNNEDLNNYKGDIFIVNESIIDKLNKYKNNNTDIITVREYLLEITNQKVSEIIIDGLFKDTYYNVILNIKEMLRYNQDLEKNERVLDDNKINFYKTIINIDKIKCNEKINLYNTLKSQNINLTFYEDLRKIKDLSYNKIKNSIINLNNCQESKNKDLSNNIGIDIYDFTDKNYFMLVKTADDYQEKTSHRTESYSIISNENNNVYDYKHKKFIYGYSNFDIDSISHVFEIDAGVQDIKNNTLSVGTRKVNRIMTLGQLTKNSNEYNEINIVNKKDNNDLYQKIKPDFLVVFEKIENKDIEESKRLNIPIVIIKQQLLSKTNDNVIDYQGFLDDYTDIDLCFIEEMRRKTR